MPPSKKRKELKFIIQTCEIARCVVRFAPTIRRSTKKALYETLVNQDLYNTVARNHRERCWLA